MSGVKNVQKALCFIGSDAIMAESESSSSILSIWLAYEHEFEKVVLWPTPKAGSGDREIISKISGLGPARGVLGCGP